MRLVSAPASVPAFTPLPACTSMPNRASGIPYPRHRHIASVAASPAYPCHGIPACSALHAAARQNHVLGGHKLYTEYAAPSQLLTAGSGAGTEGSRGGAGESRGAGGSVPLDWVCGMCQAVNFARLVHALRLQLPGAWKPRPLSVGAEGWAAPPFVNKPTAGLLVQHLAALMDEVACVCRQDTLPKHAP